MKKSLLFALTLLFATQMVLADGAADVKRDTFGKCDEQYYSVIKLKIKRPEAVPFSINAQGGKVEFSTGNLQYQASTKTFRFATRQWEFVGNGEVTSVVRWDSAIITWNAVESKYDTVYSAKNSDNRLLGKHYGGWIDLFGWGTSGFDRRKVDGKDPYNVYFYPYSSSTSILPDGAPRTANYYGYGPSVGLAGVVDKIDTSDAISRNYDWGQYNDVYCVWVGYDTTRAEGNSGHDSVLFDSTMFNKRVWRTLTDSEWHYMLNTRKIENKKSAAWSFGYIKKATTADFDWFGTGGSDPLAQTTMDSVAGLFIFPDDFELAEAKKIGFAEGDMANIKYGEAWASATGISYKSFMALEKLGVIFLPAAGFRNGKNINNLQGIVAYWSVNPTAAAKNQNAVVMNSANTGIIQLNNWNKFNGMSVRLVRDLNTKLEKPVSAYF